MTRISRAFFALCLVGTAFTLPAQAEELPPVVQLLFDNWKTQTQLVPTYGAIENNGSGNITIANLGVDRPASGSEPSVKLTVDKVTLEGVSDAGGGMFEIANATFSGAKASIKGEGGVDVSVDMPEGHAEGWYVKGRGANPTPEDSLRAAMNVAKKMSSGKITVQAMGQTITSDGYESTWEGDPQTGAGTFTTKVSNVVIPESALAMADPTGMLKQLGYSGLAFDLMGDGKVDIGGGKMGMAMNFGYVAHDMGTMKVSFDASEIPLSLYAEVQKVQGTGKDPDVAALMPDLQGITINGFSLRFEDNSITKKVLPLAAAAMGMPDPNAFAVNAGAMVQMSLMQLNNQAFTEQVKAAVDTFLKDPKSLTVSVKPPAPLKVQELMALNPANPGEAIGKLGITVTAND